MYVFMNIYAYTYIYMHVTTIKENSDHVFEREQGGYIESFEGRKWEGDMI